MKHAYAGGTVDIPRRGPLTTPTYCVSPTPGPPPTTPVVTPVPAASSSTLWPVAFAPPPGRPFATLEDFWTSTDETHPKAEWLLEEPTTGLPIGESDTVYLGGNEFWSYLHASTQSANVVDQCGDPVPFPGCTTLWKSHDGGRHFTLENPVCLFPCATCPCDPQRDHVNQQQYPRVFFQSDEAYLVYEFGAYVYMRTSKDGLHWSEPQHVAGTGIWHHAYGPCGKAEAIGTHPHVNPEFEWDCLVGGPPGIYVKGNLLYVFVAFGRAPGHLGCLVGNRHAGAVGLRKCTTNPLLSAENGYGPIDILGPAANPYFEFRTLSSADVVRAGSRYYMVYEGVRGPSSPQTGDDQFALGLARSVGLHLDGTWEKYPGNPILMDLPGNVGVGHADLVIVGEATYLYTATPGGTRGRYVLVQR